MAQRMDFRVGMDVKSRDGHRLGKVIGLAEDALVVEKGVFYPRDYRVPFRSVQRIDGDVIHLSLDREQLQKASLGEVLEASDRLDLGYDVRTESEKEAEASRPVGYDPNAPTPI